jgi:hypothetical protein
VTDDRIRLPADLRVIRLLSDPLWLTLRMQQLVFALDASGHALDDDDDDALDWRQIERQDER